MSLCEGGECPLRFLCLRFLAEPVGRQDYFGALPLEPDGSCAEFRDARESFRRALDPKAVEYRAYMLSTQILTQDDCFWFLAEIHARVGRLFNAQWDSENPGQPAAQGDPLSDAILREQAYFLWKNHPHSLSELHWLLAEQQLLYEVLVQRSCEVSLEFNYGKISWNLTRTDTEAGK